jgi:flagellin-like hook-associated protein FlgL
MATRNVNDAIGLVNSIDTAAQNIQNSLIRMKTVSMSESDLLVNLYGGDKGRICDFLQQTEEAIIAIAVGHSWNGLNYMIGGGENDHTTTVYTFDAWAGGSGATGNLQMTFKSWHPHSAIDRTMAHGIYGDPADPDIPVLNATAGTDTHAYGDAAMYRGNPNVFAEGHLHGDTQEAIDHTIIQLDRAIAGVTNERARLGAYMKRLSKIADNVQGGALSAQRTESQVVDADYAHAAAEFSKNEILKKSSMAIIAQANRRGSKLLELLR